MSKITFEDGLKEVLDMLNEVNVVLDTDSLEWYRPWKDDRSYITNEEVYDIVEFRHSLYKNFWNKDIVWTSEDLNKILKIKGKTYFVVEMPNYKLPLFKNVAINVIEKTKAFIYGAGKIILAISIVLWFLASYGPGEKFNNAEKIVVENTKQNPLPKAEFENGVASQKLENSYIGIMGKAIEPAISPLGYDWKIGIAIISSFAAREVFVGTLATIYSVGGSDNEVTIKNKMAAEVHPETGEKIFNFASGISLLLFYAFAMQCASTLAVTKKETNSWKWPLGQLIFMSGFAYIVAFLAYQILK